MIDMRIYQYMLGYGGGLVGGDSVAITCAVKEGATGTCNQTLAGFHCLADRLAPTTARPSRWLHLHALFANVRPLAVLCTQATTKVFKAEIDRDFVRQAFAFDVAGGALLAVLPDPITCFQKAKYRQRQEFRLQGNDANIVLVDWLTSGRKRNFLATGSLKDDRRETHEHWDFDEYDSTADVFVGDELVLSDRVRLIGTVHIVSSACYSIRF
jgi:urease accessory protein UreH